MNRRILPALALCALLAVAIAAASAAPQASGAAPKRSYVIKKCGPGINQPARQISANRYRKLIACLIHAERKRKGKPRLKLNKRLTRSARRHSRVMLRKDCLAPICPGEKHPTERARKKGYFKGYRGGGVAELWNYGTLWSSSPRQALRIWKKYPENRAILYSTGYRHLGVGVVFGRGQEVFLTVDFGYRY